MQDDALYQLVVAMIDSVDLGFNRGITLLAQPQICTFVLSVSHAL